MGDLTTAMLRSQTSLLSSTADLRRPRLLAMLSCIILTGGDQNRNKTHDVCWRRSATALVAFRATSTHPFRDSLVQPTVFAVIADMMDDKSASLQSPFDDDSDPDDERGEQQIRD